MSRRFFHEVRVELSAVVRRMAAQEINRALFSACVRRVNKRHGTVCEKGYFVKDRYVFDF